MPEEVKPSPCTVMSQTECQVNGMSAESCDSNSESPDSSVCSDREMNSRLENSYLSEDGNCYRQNGHETIEVIPTRTLKTSVPKPAANPLQFVKIGPCDLYRSAQQQLQKVSEVKKPKKEVKDETEDWQSNLDNWKCNRRKQQEHIIERVVEVKKLELEEHDRNRKRSKTFSEMMEERSSKGRKLSLPLYLEEDSDDLSDLGISSGKNITSSTIPEENDEATEELNGDDAQINARGGGNRKPSNSEEAGTYESAIQSYETRMKSITNGDCSQKSTTSTVTPPPRKYNTRRASATKIEEKLTELERIKNRSVSSTDLTETNKKQVVNIPKVNICKRKEVFEKITDVNDASAKSKKSGDELPPVKSIRERLSSLEKQMEENSGNKAKNVALIEVSVKDRLSCINEKMRHSTCTEKAALKERAPESPQAAKEYPYEPNCNGHKREDVVRMTMAEYSSGRSSGSEDYDQVQMNHFHHRSLDSLQGHMSPNGFCYERVQSLECIDCCSNYPASVLSGDTDREDSGIHTADVSSSVSQADDFDLHPDSSIDVEMKAAAAPMAVNEAAAPGPVKNSKSSHTEFSFVSQGKLRNDDNQNKESSGDVDTSSFNSEEFAENLMTESAGSVGEGKPQENGFASKRRSAGNQKTEHCSSSDMKSREVGAVHVEEKAHEYVATCAKESSVSEKDQNGNKCDNYVHSSAEENVTDVVQHEQNEKSANSTRLNVPNSAVEEFNGGYRDSNVDLEESTLEKPNMNNIESEPLYVDQRNNNNNADYVPEFTSDVNEENMDYGFVQNKKFLKETTNMLPSKTEQIFAFESSTAAEPPKEKPPPPPPLENSDEELDATDNTNCLRRMDSTKRIKKELRQKRSSFLGIEDFNNDSYLEPELESVKPPPDMTMFLQEERRLEKLLYRQSICSESDSTQGESRDSGVELDKKETDENSWVPENAHSRQDSETYANTSTTSEEDEIIKKEREILEILELEEQRHYENETKNGCNNLGEKLVLRLKELERQKSASCWSTVERLNEEHAIMMNQQNYNKYDEICVEQKQPYSAKNDYDKDSILAQQQWSNRSLQDISPQNVNIIPNYNSVSHSSKNHRNSMPNIQQELKLPAQQCQRVPPPIPPNKPTHFREPPPVPPVTKTSSSPQQMTKQTLQALSAVPRSKIVATDSWVMSKKKPRQEAYNYQHWLIQEAEHRRITEYQQRHGNENVIHSNYVNAHHDYGEQQRILPHDVLPDTDNRTSHQNRNLYAHPQVLPYRSSNQGYNQHEKNHAKPQYNKPLPDSVIQTLTQRVQNRFAVSDKQRRRENYSNVNINNNSNSNSISSNQEKLLSVSGKKKCSHCGEELGRGAAMIIESLRLFYHIDCFKCCVCCVQLGDGLMGTDVRVRNNKLHCHSCYSNDEGLKFSCV